MEQVTENQAPAGQDQIKILTELVQQLLSERECKQEPEDPYFSTRIPVTDFSVYSELTEALPSIGENFFQTPLTEEERKVAIHSCPKNMKKTDSAIYGIQLALAQATRPIDYYVHRRIQENKDMITSEDSEILFASTIRALLSEIASKVTQASSSNQFQTANGSRGVGGPYFKKTCHETTTNPALLQSPAEDPERLPCRGLPRYVQIGMVQDNGQPMSSGRSGERIQNPLQDPRLRITSAGGVTRLNIRAVTDTVDLHEDPPPSSRMGQPEEIEISGELHRQEPSISVSLLPGKLIQRRIEADETGNPEPVLLEEPANVMERDMEPRDLEAAYQYKGTVDGVVCTEARECGGSIKIRGHYLPGTARINRKDMVSLPQDQHPPTSDLCSIRTKSSGRPQQTDSAN
ncbi:hypothetical protein AYI70_g9998 [Smittium culicis]|uniref:Uncharacterized protein n=1 Tax=Smittium culicis TaxID=133412 RepID=A0A1R1X8J7_9FUNG|nr:hypothetical protein AYI70_g9998 [Smittium culicis]